jgi:hypothetical protein
VLPDARFALDGHEATTAEGTATLRVIDPERPERLARVKEPLPEGAVNETDDAEIVKSMIVTGRTIEWLRGPLVALNVTV